MTAIHEVFSRASAHLKKPRLRIGNVVVSKAPASGRNAGALYVTIGYEYMGRIMNARFFAVHGVTDQQRQQIIDQIQSPKNAALKYGRMTGNCACCGRELTRADSIARGIGPVCAGRWGF